MDHTTSQIDWKHIIATAGSYPAEAFDFVRGGLAHTVERVHTHARQQMALGMAEPDSNHVTGQQLCLGLRDFAIEQYGMLAPVVLRHWNISRTDDFGRIVYAMIEGGVMSKTADDSFDDFCGVFDFEEAFSASQLSSRVGGRRRGA
ncbi:MAG: hypothetical protein LW636_08830 [Planctomycetaceae bacterium]|nr:hypothetical protein [Planctomycetaceae bacterium]